MRILHTSDWHLGKSLEGRSRLPEQELFLKDFIKIVEEKNINLVIIAGDVFDSYNPPARAQRLFYDSIKKMANYGQRAVLVIAGNHDSPARLTAADQLAREHGVILLGKPDSCAVTGKFGQLEILDSGPGFVKLKLNDEEIIIITLPYPNEKRLNEILTYDSDEELRQQSYSKKIGDIFSELSSHYRKDTINIAAGHFYLTGGVESESERPIQMGGSMAVETDRLPEAQYIALGHLHHPQQINCDKTKVYYSGSPLQYSKSEANYSKSIYLIEAQAGSEAEVEEIYLNNYKPIEVWRCKGVEAALQKCVESRDKEIWVYLEIETERSLNQSEIKEIKDLCKGILQIKPIFPEDEEFTDETVDFSCLKIDELFESYYRENSGIEPSQELMDLFYKIIEEEGEED